MEVKARKYGRGKFEAHPQYVKYMEFIVDNPNYAGMPHARDSDGHVNWQVSSGKTTSFYQYYQKRFDWWVKKADSLKIKGHGNSDDRFSITARIIHPGKYRPCRLCGKLQNVGYYYVNSNLANRLRKVDSSFNIAPGTSITTAISELSKNISYELLTQELQYLFPMRAIDFTDLSTILSSFERSIHLRSQWLSPGFMCNPPDRLDGFHDYGLCCRKGKDPGRSDLNLKSYIHDRRAFNWWAEGDWKAADTLFSSAGVGTCIQCGKVGKISPDHIGPLSCGFKHMPTFNPLCSRCNSSKNRRLTFSDVRALIAIEKTQNESVASWQIRSCWDSLKNKIKNDRQAKILSNVLRGIEDYYIRFLWELKEEGLALFMTRYLSPKLAHNHVKFITLDAATLKFEKFEILTKKTTGSLSLESRIIRIAIDELDEYVAKPLEDRKIPKIKKTIDMRGAKSIEELISSIPQDDYSSLWDDVFAKSNSKEKKDMLIRELLLDSRYLEERAEFSRLDGAIRNHFNKIGLVTSHNPF